MSKPMHAFDTTPRLHRRGFTLVEILIVVAILGILAAIVLPRFGTASDEARQKVFAASVKQYVRAARLYMAENPGQRIEDSGSGVLPAELAQYIDASRWENGTPIGGVWDAEQDQYAGMASGIGVHFDSGTQPSDAYMARIDQVLDDGDLTTGMFRKFTDDRFYFIILSD